MRNNYFTIQQAQRIRQEVEALLADANYAQWRAMHCPAEEREAWRTVAARKMDEIKRLGEEANDER